MKNFTQKLIGLQILFLNINICAQDITPEMFVLTKNTGANMTLGISSPDFDQFVGGQIGAFYDLNENGSFDEPYIYGNLEITECVGLYTVTEGFMGLAIWGDDSSTNYKDGLAAGESPQFAILHEGNVILVNEIPQFPGYVTNGTHIVQGAELYAEGCSDESACNFTIMPYGNVNYIEECEYPQTINVFGSEIFLGCNGILQPLNTGDNQTVGFNSSKLDQFAGGQVGAFFDLNGDGALEIVGSVDIEAGFFGLAIWGDDSTTPEKDGLNEGEVPYFAILHNGNVIAMEEVLSSFVGYSTNATDMINDFILSIDATGCNDLNACNISADQYQDVTYLNQNCEFPEQFYDCSGNCINDEDGDQVCDENEVPGCQDPTYIEFNELATDDDGSCLTTWEDGYNDVSYQLDTMTSAYLTLLESPQCEEIVINFEVGWNLFGYTSSQMNQDIGDIIGSFDDKIYIIKDINGDQYWPEFNFNGIGDFIPGQGYQLKATESFSISFEN